MKRLSLAEPNVVLSAPRSIQILCAAGAIAVLTWFLVGLGQALGAGEALGPVHYFGMLSAAALLFAVGRPKFWKRWISAAADPYGVYLRDRGGSWHCVPWKHIREVSVEDRKPSPNVVIYAHLSEEERKALAPGSWVFQGLGNERKPLGLVVPNRFGSADEQREALESVRRAA